MDMNSIMKKLAVRKQDSQQYHQQVTVGAFDGPPPQNANNSRYTTGHHQPSMSFAGKKITTVSGIANPVAAADTTKRMSVNLQSGGFINKVASMNQHPIHYPQHHQAATSKTRVSHSKGKSSGILGMVSNSQTR